MDFPYNLDSVSIEQLNIESVKAELNNVISQYLEIAESIPEHLAKRPVIGTWSFKDLLSHFIGWNIITVENIKRRFNDLDSVWIEDESIDSFNQSVVDSRSDNSWISVQREFKETTAELLSIYQNIPTDKLTLNMREDYPGEFPMFMNILIDLKHFGYDHLPEVVSGLKKLKDEG